MLCGAGKYYQPGLSGLIHECFHWLPIPQRIRFQTVPDDVRMLWCTYRHLHIGLTCLNCGNVSTPTSELSHLIVATL